MIAVKVFYGVAYYLNVFFPEELNTGIWDILSRLSQRCRFLTSGLSRAHSPAWYRGVPLGFHAESSLRSEAVAWFSRSSGAMNQEKTKRNGKVIAWEKKSCFMTTLDSSSSPCHASSCNVVALGRCFCANFLTIKDWYSEYALSKKNTKSLNQNNLWQRTKPDIPRQPSFFISFFAEVNLSG